MELRDQSAELAVEAVGPWRLRFTPLHEDRQRERAIAFRCLDLTGQPTVDQGKRLGDGHPMGGGVGHQFLLRRDPTCGT